MTHRSEALVLFGVSGDLAKKKLFPALYQLAADDRLPERVIGVASSDWDTAKLRQRARESIDGHQPGEVEEAVVDRLLAALSYVQGDYRDGGTYDRLSEALGKSARPLVYLAIPPGLFDDVVRGLAGSGLNRTARLVVEKPFGRDLESARALNRCVLNAFPESHVFRIDHFLGKEEVLDLLVFRLANPIFEPAWNRHYIDSVQITMAEDFGVEGRGRFYDEVGTIRDVVQNHLLQLLTLVAMEPPVTSHADDLRDEKVKVLRSMAPIRPENVVRGQFAGYRDEPGVAPGSIVETYVALKLFIDSWRWAGVPFYIRAGKNLPVTSTEVLIEFQRPPRHFFVDADAPLPHPNHLVFRMKPRERISLAAQIKQPGDGLVSRLVNLSYDYDEHRDGARRDAYAKLLDEAMDGDARLFARADSVEEAWRVVEPALTTDAAPHTYARGSWGPPEARTLLAEGDAWHDPVVADRTTGSP